MALQRVCLYLKTGEALNNRRVERDPLLHRPLYLARRVFLARLGGAFSFVYAYIVSHTQRAETLHSPLSSFTTITLLINP